MQNLLIFRFLILIFVTLSERFEMKLRLKAFMISLPDF